MKTYLREDGYLAFSDYFNPLARKDGSVLLHRHVYAEYYKDYDLEGFHVHHIDGDILNNSPSNLIKLTEKEHWKEHSNYRDDIPCACCGVIFHPRADENIYCSKSCSSKINSGNMKKYEVDAGILQRLILIVPLIKLSKYFGVSDVALKKRVVALGLVLPARLGVRKDSYKFYLYELLN